MRVRRASVMEEYQVVYLHTFANAVKQKEG
jgi:hypothetical protein